MYERVLSRAELEARRAEAAPVQPLKRRAYDDLNGLDSQYTFVMLVVRLVTRELQIYSLAINIDTKKTFFFSHNSFMIRHWVLLKGPFLFIKHGVVKDYKSNRFQI